MSKVFHHPDSVAGLVLIVVGGIATYLSYQIAPGPDVLTLPPNFFPLLCTIGVVLIGIAMMVQAAWAAPVPFPALVDARAVAVFALMLVYFLTFESVDFRLGSWVFMLATMLAMGCRSIPQLVILPLAFVAAVYVVFSSIFSILLPTWI
ncbi:tripartite tricarboxylate transporter TctB family protein [Propylenella binzhouense]|uniref:Tripartite tricarboxylate transporter TctB family protein n=1 Tax=Propylenella binzhouense TaxID=2555902 RepID=A0A964T2B4_9HYPH|nr:tripartite tricarboxylate transporter TctB family protein [Propylenella binzhouense]MYZ47113.1 tripartite tricarboxylate transporter TctB family protein [Propylenella binzhouense]